ncbi:MAG TPA: diguanylate cyclase, partial [Candidatus Berkiella sp.]|nr:diguanylate cyclase [Candidatus Berkiella sp.]
GEEFSIILPDTSLSGGLHVAERLRQCVEVLQIPNQKASNGIITISIGVATAEPSKEFSGELLVGAADSALYEAKQTGRNCIVGTKMEPLIPPSADKRPQYKMTRHLPTTSGSSSAH